MFHVSLPKHNSLSSKNNHCADVFENHLIFFLVLLPKYVSVDTIVKPSCTLPPTLPLYFFLIAFFLFTVCFSKALSYMFIFFLYSFKYFWNDYFKFYLKFLSSVTWFLNFSKSDTYFFCMSYMNLLSSFLNRS